MAGYDSSSINVLKGPVAVRKRPGMYLGNIDSLAANRVICELIANSVDLFLVGLATTVRLEIVGSVVRVSDDGSGLPFDKGAVDGSESSLAECFFTSLHNSPTVDGHAPHIHIMGGGLGLGVVNAFCERVTVTSANGINVYKQIFGKGEVLSDCEVKNSNGASGTTIELILDKEIFGDNKPDRFDLRKTMFEVAHFYPGLVVEFQRERFCASEGLLDLAYIYFRDQLVTCGRSSPIKFSFDGVLNQVQIFVAAVGQVAEPSDTHFLSWVNGSPTVLGGVHVDSLRNAFLQIGWNPSVALVHTVMHNPKFAGPSKDAFASAEAGQVIKALLEDPLCKMSIPAYS